MFGKRIKGWSMTVFALVVVSLLSLRAPAVGYAATPITVTTLADENTSDGDCALREAILAAQLVAEGGPPRLQRRCRVVAAHAGAPLVALRAL